MYCYLGNFDKLLERIWHLYKLKPKILPKKAWEIAEMTFRSIEITNSPQMVLRIFSIFEKLVKVLENELEEADKIRKKLHKTEQELKKFKRR